MLSLTSGLQIQTTDLHNSDSSDGETQHSKRTGGMKDMAARPKPGVQERILLHLSDFADFMNRLKFHLHYLKWE